MSGGEGLCKKGGHEKKKGRSKFIKKKGSQDQVQNKRGKKPEFYMNATLET